MRRFREKLITTTTNYQLPQWFYGTCSDKVAGPKSQEISRFSRSYFQKIPGYFFAESDF